MNFRKKHIISCCIASLLLLYLNSFISIQNYNQLFAQQRKITLHNADSLVGSMIGSIRIKNYMGNVRLEQGNVNLSCDLATHFEEMNKVELRGNVIINQDEMTLSSPEIDYDGNSGKAYSRKGIIINDRRSVLIAPVGIYSTKTLIAEFTGDVTIEDDSVRIIADKVIYNRKTKNSQAYGDVIIRGKNTDALLTGDTVEYFPSQSYTIARGKPVMFQIDTIRENLENPEESELFMNVKLTFDTLSISCDTMEAFREFGSERYFFKKNVEFARNKIAAKADYSNYYRTLGIIELYQTPILWFDSTQLFSDTTIIYTQNNKLSKIYAQGNAFAGTSSDSIWNDRINQISGTKIEIIFNKDSIDKIVGYGNSKSLYFLIDESGSEGASRNGSDTIIIEFSEGKPEFIRWIGAVQGEFFPENFISINPKDYFLPSFRWEAIRPAIKTIPSR